MTSAKIICDSTNWLNKRLTTYVLEYPRYIHAELLTHRVFSKNSASSRAIPVEKFIKAVQDRPVKPLWTENQKGMQGPIITDKNKIHEADVYWNEARDHAVEHANELNRAGIHKQNINRLLEPWMYHKIVLTGTEFDNWFTLRNHPAAQPEIQELAKMMKHAMDNSVPTLLEPGEWHIPFTDNITDKELKKHIWPSGIGGAAQLTYDIYDNQALITKLKMSVARCGRVSYNNFDGTSSITADLDLYHKLVVSEPLHASPAEHQARVPHPYEIPNHMEVKWVLADGILNGKEVPVQGIQKVGKYISNLNGWIQLRKLIEANEF